MVYKELLGAVTWAAGELTTDGGVKFSSDVATFTPTSGVVPGQWRTIDAFLFFAETTSLGQLAEFSVAGVEAVGYFGRGATGPYMGNLHFRIAPGMQHGWDTVRLEASFDNFPTPTIEGDATVVWFKADVAIRKDTPVIDLDDDARVTFYAGIGDDNWIHIRDYSVVNGKIEDHWSTQPRITLRWNRDEHG